MKPEPHSHSPGTADFGPRRAQSNEGKKTTRRAVCALMGFMYYLCYTLLLRQGGLAACWAAYGSGQRLHFAQISTATTRLMLTWCDPMYSLPLNGYAPDTIWTLDPAGSTSTSSIEAFLPLAGRDKEMSTYGREQ